MHSFTTMTLLNNLSIGSVKFPSVWKHTLKKRVLPKPFYPQGDLSPDVERHEDKNIWQVKLLCTLGIPTSQALKGFLSGRRLGRHSFL